MSKGVKTVSFVPSMSNLRKIIIFFFYITQVTAGDDSKPQPSELSTSIMVSKNIRLLRIKYKY